jgi:hypothetical protein
MDDEARRLVDDQEVGVFVHDTDGDLGRGREVERLRLRDDEPQRSAVPGPTTALDFRATPSAVRLPAEISFWTWLRDRPVASATQRSTRWAGAVGGT